MKDIIYVNGCSFTTGIDLGDHIMPGYGNDISFSKYLSFLANEDSIPDISNYMNWRDAMHPQIVPGTLGLTYGGATFRLEHELRYSNILEKLTGIEVINKSAPGCDNDSIYLRTCNDVYDLKKQGYNVKKIIFQFTGMNRHSYIKQSKDVTENIYGKFYLDYNKLDDEFMCRAINFANRNQPSYTNNEKHFVENYHTNVLFDEMNLRARWLNYFTKLKMYKDAIHTDTGVDPIMVDSIFMDVDLEIDKQGYKAQDLDFLNNSDVNTYMGRIIKSVFPSDVDSMARMVHKDRASLTPGLHFNKEVHELFATYLARKYFNE